MPISFTIKEQVWQVMRQPGVAAGCRAGDDNNVKSQSSGLRFLADDGTTRFLPIDYPDLPSETELRGSPIDALVDWFQRSQ